VPVGCRAPPGARRARPWPRAHCRRERRCARGVRDRRGQTRECAGEGSLVRQERCVEVGSARVIHSARQRRREAQGHSSGDRGNERAAEPVAPGKMRVRNDCPRKIKDSRPSACAVVSAPIRAADSAIDLTARGARRRGRRRGGWRPAGCLRRRPRAPRCRSRCRGRRTCARTAAPGSRSRHGRRRPASRG
jgi:hypothetical protein